MAIKGVPLAVLGAGGILVWSGLFNKKITQTIQDLVKGTQPQPGPPGGTIPVGSTAGAGATVAGPNPQGQAIATDALAYAGQGYVWGGAPASGLGHWDCSSFTNWVIGHDMKMSIPGFPHGSYTGSSHGPTTLVWLASIGTLTHHIPRSEVSAGDLCVWQTHMGIAINGSQMISAANPKDGTEVSGIDNFIPLEVLVCLRLKGVTSAPRSGGGGGKKK